MRKNRFLETMVKTTEKLQGAETACYVRELGKYAPFKLIANEKRLILPDSVG